MPDAAPVISTTGLVMVAPSKDEVLNDRGELQGCVALHAVTGFRHPQDQGGGHSAAQLPLVVVVEDRVRPHTPDQQHRHGDLRQRLPERGEASAVGGRAGGRGGGGRGARSLTGSRWGGRRLAGRGRETAVPGP